MTDDAVLQRAVANEFSDLADLLDGISDEEWDTPSLCEGWRIREVVAHVTMAARYSEERFMTRLRECEFDFTRLSNEIARSDGELATSDLVADLRSDTMRGWTPPGGGYHGALNHVVIHGLDVTVPLGVPRRVPEETIRIVLNDLTAGGGHSNFGVNIEGRRLRATDLGWSYGSGAELCGAGEDLALTICGRTLPAGRVEGDPL
ncbi:maleylpyruvate isomerase family mycothiol-dependent enzyme [Rhodococcus pseudokoreensis]|uniref:Maleylpyruvate isomerase family mycothiol-dependent enzyme n=1 Tax=Rhodococcus pseudokoreensis TaxID=2811421 RepID=A0A974WAA7_9NOCA|nr:maleylpyruvate isomerase family mycothiol-dependent enzyme [Rhodococcus pseudokoreensis]QSE93652.1 maleylpyruvate isomerase family mycothiol-dependent enzyme [Rhodococcus pseudokoreensis]